MWTAAVWPDLGNAVAGSEDPELDGIVRLAVHVCSAPAFVSLGPSGPARQASTRAWALRGSDGEVRGWLTVGSGALDTWQREALDLLAGQGGVLLERRERERAMLDTIGELLRGTAEHPIAPREVDGPLRE